ncbi:MAG: hypothetical protein KAU48_08795, partial [Candidatus Thorarchaeota archaeon]|nr:hypothetical protein [Candidatus Thorarchaeota archaeon]
MRRLGLALFLLLFFIGSMPMSGGNFSATTVSTSDGPRENDGILDTGLPLKLHDSQATTASIYQNGTALWNQTYDGSGDEYVQSVVECGNGGFALAGYTNSFGASSQAGWLVRTDALGNHLWNQTYDGPNVDFLYSVVECSDGGFALAGNTMSFGVSSMAGWLVRTDEDGNLLWNMTYDAPFHEHFDMLVEVSDGGFAICGTTDSYGASNFAGWLLRTDSAGNHQWNMTFDGPNDEQFNAIIESTDGGFALVGITDSFGVSMQDGWLVRTASDGSHLWNQTYSTPNYDELYDLAECEDGTFALVGLANSTGFDGGGWLIKTDSDGNHLWNKTYDGSDMDGILSVVESKYGGLALGGVKDYGMSGSMGWLIRTDDEGNQYWNQTYGSSGYDCLYSIVELRGGGFVIAGITDGFGVSLNAAWLVRAGPSYDWIQTYDRTWADDVYDVIECQNGGFAIAGYSTKPPYQAWLIRTDMDGNQLWDRRYGFINHTTAKAIIECSTGGFLLAGFMDTLMPGGRAAFLLRTDAGGNTLWNWTFDGPGADGLSDLVECSSGGYAACGWTSSYGTTRAMWLVRFDSDGNHLWNYTYNRAKEDYGFGLVECSGGGFALTGNTQGAG